MMIVRKLSGSSQGIVRSKNLHLICPSDKFVSMEKQSMRIQKPQLFVIILILLVIMLIAMTIWVAHQMMQQL